MAKKKSTTWDDEPEEDQDVAEDGTEQPPDEPVPPEPTSTEASDEGVYLVDSEAINIKGQPYKKGDKVSLTPEELEAVQASGVRILPA